MQFWRFSHLKRAHDKGNKEVKPRRVGDSMVEKCRVKITVLKKLSTREIFGENPPFGESVAACGQFDVGQEFVVGEDGGMPAGFCHWAWNDLYKVVTTLKYGGSFSRKTGKETSIVRCCTDGLRPVIFKLERT